MFLFWIFFNRITEHNIIRKRLVTYHQSKKLGVHTAVLGLYKRLLIAIPI
jgi:hypothetical protein